jgi:hypothetical protein
MLATAFSRDCTDADPARVIRRLVERDNRVLLLRGDDIVPGPAFLAAQTQDDAGEDAAGPGNENATRVPVPEGISPRIQNLFMLDLDLQSRLDGFLNAPSSQETA